MQTNIGSVVALWRYPVKSMLGEELNATDVGEDGLFGDRAYALLDNADGKVATAKNPRKWPRMFEFRAALADLPRPNVHMPPVRISLPDGTLVSSEQEDVDRVLSAALDRQVRLATRASTQSGGGYRTSEEYWPDMEGLDHRDTVTDFELPSGTFFDCATVHVLTTATLDRLRELYPDGRFEVRRFRPNIVVDIADGAKEFVENGWVGHTLAVGDAVRLRITGPAPRCVMTTLAQADLPKDAGILRTAVHNNQANIGVYASVVQGGHVRRGDAVRLQEK